MEYSVLGKTGRKVSRLGFGGATAGIKNYVHAFDPESEKEQQTVINAMHKALELGINYFDTAAGYGNGISELVFGRALKKVPGKDIFLATKCAVTDGPGVRRSFEESLKRLQRDRVDLLQIHGTALSEKDIEMIFQPSGMLDEMVKMQSEGMVRYLGFTGEAQNPPFYELLNCGAFDAMQISYNFIFQHPYDPSWKSGSIYEAEKKEMGIIAMRTVTSGIFQKWIRKVNPDNTFDYSPHLLQFQLSNPLIDVALVGMRTAGRVEDNVRILHDRGGRIDIDELHNRKA